MTLTPAIREALDKLRSDIEDRTVEQERCHPVTTTNEDIAKAELALLSVVAAEEGRKYEQVLEGVRSALSRAEGIPYYAFGDNEAACAMASAIKEALSALVQWEAK